ncbi:MAG: serine hydrolase [Sphingopyxis sp.]|nr:serine hydrolase [Sphingopyxis sp.]
MAARPEAAAKIDAIETFARHQVETLKLPGLTVSLADRSGWHHTMLVGRAELESAMPIGPEHLFQIGSITKSMAALCAFRLLADGRIGLDTPINEYLPGLAILSPRPITIGHLVNHSSGLPSDSPLRTAFQAGAIAVETDPGSFWSYSNIGYQLLGLVIERAAGCSFPEYLERVVLQPLGMTQSRASIIAADRAHFATGYGPRFQDRPSPIASAKSVAPWVNVVGAHGSVASTARDMGHYMTALLAMADGAHQPVLPIQLGRQFMTRSTSAPGWEEGADFAYGLAIIERHGRKLLHHTGGMIGFSSSLHLDAENGVAAFASTNVGHLSYRPAAITQFACDWLSGVESYRRSPIVSNGSRATAAMVDREYRSANGDALRVRHSNGGVTVTVGEIAIALIQEAPGYFIAVDPAQTSHSLILDSMSDRSANLWWGDIEFALAEKAIPVFARPSPLASLAGHYENDDPWFGTVRISVRGDDVFLNDITTLHPIAPDQFRLGDDPRSPERVKFHTSLAGHPHTLEISGVFYEYRRTATDRLCSNSQGSGR